MNDKVPGKPQFRRPEELQEQLDQIGGRFLGRVLAECDAMEEVLIELSSGNASAAGALEMFAHRIHGSSAVLGFVELSAAAGALEALLLSVQSQGAPVTVVREIGEHMAVLRAAARTGRVSR